MKLHTLESKLILPMGLSDAWNFFCNPQNLSHLTPPDLGLEIQTEDIVSIYPGLIITYNVQPFPISFVKMTWVTEITHVREREFFVDEQRFGPYRFWHHKHYFREVPDGTEVRDVVHYLLPLMPPGVSQAIHRFMVRPRLESIFDYRASVLSNPLFGS